MLLLLASGLAACGLLVSFDYDTSEEEAPTFAVSGTVDGLGKAQLGLVLNGQPALALGDGPFAFPSRLADGASYVVTLQAPVPGHPCTLEREQGTITHADATNIAVHCTVSHDADLSNLVVASGDLAPTFDTKVEAYTTKPSGVKRALPPPTTTTVTATVHEPGAIITINGLVTASGAPSAPVPLMLGATPVDVVVTAADGIARRHYKVGVMGSPLIEYLKASNPVADAHFGSSVAISGDTLVIGSPGEMSLAKGVNSLPEPYGAQSTGAVYVFVRTGAVWSQQAYLKASNTRAESARFGESVAVAGDIIVVGAPIESSSAVGVNGNQADATGITCGAAYVFTRTGTTWSQQAYLKSSNTRAIMRFGQSVAVAGQTIAVGADVESSGGVGVNGDQASTAAPGAGAVYVFTRSGSAWSQQAYVKASNTRGDAYFGTSVALSGDSLAVGSASETSAATTVGGSQAAAAGRYGATYVFTRSGTTWSQQAYIKPSNLRADADFGQAVALRGDTLAVGSPGESSAVASDPANTAAQLAGAVYVFTRSGSAWSQQAYVKPSKPQSQAYFGGSVALDENALGVGAYLESGGAKGFDGNEADPTAFRSGAAFIFLRSGTTWSQRTYVKAPNSRDNAFFGKGIAITLDVAVVTAEQESSKAKGINGDQADSSLLNAGAAYVFR